MNTQLQSYTQFVISLTKSMETRKDELMHAAVGCSTESGELLDAVKKYWAYDKPLDMENVKEELGDLLFYFTMVINWTGFSLQEIMEDNIKKLQKRYPNAVFNNADAIARKDKEGESK